MRKKLLLLRLDKIGDLVSTMCVDQATFLKEYDITWGISEGLGFIPESAVPVRKFFEIKSKFSWHSIKYFYNLIKQQQFDLAISFQCPWWINAALFIARIPVRAGVLSQWHSFLFLNKGLRQKRSQAIKHEADYNFDLLKFALNQNVQEMTPLFQLKPPLLDNKGLSTSFSALKLLPINEKYIVVHAGMAGSALNWPLDKYMEFIHSQSSNTIVILTGTAGDARWTDYLIEAFKYNKNVINLVGRLNTYELLFVLSKSSIVIAPSTGVLHLAAALGIRTYGIYSPIQVHHPRRWGARGALAKNFLPPDIICPQFHYCALTECKHYNCMQKIELP